MRFKAACSTLTRLAAGLAAGLAASLLAAACTAAQSVQPSAPAVTTVPTAPAAPSAPLHYLPSADAILERNFAALGGREKIHAVRSLRLEATQSAGEKRLPLKIYWKRPDRLRIEARDDGLDALQVFDGEQAWFTYPALPGFEIQFLEGAEREALRAQADLVEGPTFDYAAKGHRVELVGQGEAPGHRDRRLATPAHHRAGRGAYALVRHLLDVAGSRGTPRAARRQRGGDRVEPLRLQTGRWNPLRPPRRGTPLHRRRSPGGPLGGDDRKARARSRPPGRAVRPARGTARRPPAPAPQEAPKAPA